MLNKDNKYFEEIRRIGNEWEERRQERRERKKQIIAKYGWESEELEAWYAENHEEVFPISQGASKAYRAWWTSIDRQEDEVEMDDFLWEKDVQDFVDAFKAAGIKTFVYTNQSTAVMENLHQLAAAGCTMQGLCTITRQETRCGDEELTKVMGIRFAIG
jgi:phosphoglycolate phosphatase-like HAD superfamily hydrolase